MQKAIAQESGKYRQRRRIGVSGGDCRVGLGAEIDLGVGDPNLLNGGSDRFQRNAGIGRRWQGPCALSSSLARRLNVRVIGDGAQKRCPRTRQLLVDGAQRVSERVQLTFIFEYVIQRAQRADTLESSLLVAPLGEGAHTGTGCGHGQCMAAAGDALIAPRAHLADQIPDARAFIETRGLKRIRHQFQLRLNAISEGLGRQHKEAVAALLAVAVRAAADRHAE